MNRANTVAGRQLPLAYFSMSTAFFPAMKTDGTSGVCAQGRSESDPLSDLTAPKKVIANC